MAPTKWLLFKYNNPPPVDASGTEDVERLQAELATLKAAGYEEVSVRKSARLAAKNMEDTVRFPQGFRVFRIINPEYLKSREAAEAKKALDNARKATAAITMDEEDTSAPAAAKVDAAVASSNTVDEDDLANLFSKMGRGGRRRPTRKSRKTRHRRTRRRSTRA
jgi:hypothetical protein